MNHVDARDVSTQTKFVFYTMCPNEIDNRRFIVLYICSIPIQSIGENGMRME